MGHKAQMNIKHVGSIASIHREVDEYLRGQVTSHRGSPNKFSPSRTSNPAVALEWEAHVAALHASVRVTNRTKRKTLRSKFDPAPIAAFERVGLALGLTMGTPAFEIVRHPDGGITVWYHSEGTADQYSVYAHADSCEGFNAAEVIPALKREAFATYNVMGEF